MHETIGVNNLMQSDTKLSEFPRRRGRPPAYDRETAATAMLHTFWDKGFAATSLDDLAAATRMNRPSLYAAFGDKRAMYLAVLDRYRRDAAQQLSSVLAANPEVHDAIRALLRAGVAFYVAGETAQRGCLAVCTATSEAVIAADMRDGLAAVLAMMDGVIADRLAKGVADGQLTPGFDVAGRAMVIGAVMHSLAVRARAGAAPETLLVLADSAAAAALG